MQIAGGRHKAFRYCLLLCNKQLVIGMRNSLTGAIPPKERNAFFLSK